MIFLIMIAGNAAALSIPFVESSDVDRVQKDTFIEGEPLFVTVSGLLDGTYDLYLVPDDNLPWDSGRPVIAPPAIHVPIYVDGSVNAIPIPHSPPPGEYDIVVDDGNGVYNEGIDALDDGDVNGAGFQVVTPATIVLTPASATNDLGDEHIVTATVQYTNGNPIAGKLVTFEVIDGPYTGESGTGVTDANGEATFTYTGTKEGNDLIEASFTDDQGNLITSNVVYKYWRHPGTDYLIRLTQGTATNTVGTEHTVTATVTVGDEYGDLVPGMGLHFMVVRTHDQTSETSETIYTDENGEATFTYTRNEVGFDTITAYRTYDWGKSEPVTKEWTSADQTEIPEFPTIALPVAAILGMAFIFQRRRD